jgi:zinc D-Ala-D-Ala carboxypeptidase
VNLSDHFTLDELTVSQTAARLGLDNTPSEDVIAALKRTAHGLEMVRAYVQAPIIVSSGYRSPLVNRAVGGSPNSQHIKGEAADFTAPGFGQPEMIMRAILRSTRPIPFDQLILEFGRWVHISFSQAPRRQALVIDHAGTRSFA